MAKITYYKNADSDGCNQSAVLPVVHQEEIVIAEGEGAAPVDLLPLIPADDPVAYGGTITNFNCYDMLLDVTAVVGDDPCSSCPLSQTFTTEVFQLTVPADSVMELPSGAYQQVQATVLIDGVAGAVEVDAGDQTLRFDNCYQPCCKGAFKSQG